MSIRTFDRNGTFKRVHEVVLHFFADFFNAQRSLVDEKVKIRRRDISFVELIYLCRELSPEELEKESRLRAESERDGVTYLSIEPTISAPRALPERKALGAYLQTELGASFEDGELDWFTKLTDLEMFVVNRLFALHVCRVLSELCDLPNELTLQSCLSEIPEWSEAKAQQLAAALEIDWEDEEIGWHTGTVNDLASRLEDLRFSPIIKQHAAEVRQRVGGFY